MTRTPPSLRWVVCLAETRSVSRRSVACPLRGPVVGLVCLGCRLLVTSSVERDPQSWCLAEAPGSGAATQPRVSQFDPDRLAARLERAPMPWQPRLFEQRRPKVANHAAGLRQRSHRTRVPFSPHLPPDRSPATVSFVHRP